ncbi:hypothetical protein BDR05DRAFT_968426 [Suillus weaverae]|nr:hypothetical protein BDR05DRAFT_968426 [Suillus weaverae]
MYARNDDEDDGDGDGDDDWLTATLLQRLLQSCNPIAYALRFACTLGFSSYRMHLYSRIHSINPSFHTSSSRGPPLRIKVHYSLTGLYLALAFCFQVVLRLERIHHFQHLHSLPPDIDPQRQRLRPTTTSVYRITPTSHRASSPPKVRSNHHVLGSISPSTSALSCQLRSQGYLVCV